MLQRRTTLASLAALATAFPAGLICPAASAQTRNLLESLKPSPRMPVLFVGHGSPMNAIEDNQWRRAWQQMGAELMARAVQPQLILCISAHWLTKNGWYLTAMPEPRTIHDFSGFPRELHEQQYSAAGAPKVARSLAAELKSPATKIALGVDEKEWGLDHGTWSVLKPMFPKAQIPVLQLSMDYSRPPEEHYALGQQLAALRVNDLELQFLFLDTKTETLLKRYSETRRRHPLANEQRTVTEAIAEERVRLGSQSASSPPCLDCRRGSDR